MSSPEAMVDEDDQQIPQTDAAVEEEQKAFTTESSTIEDKNLKEPIVPPPTISSFQEPLSSPTTQQEPLAEFEQTFPTTTPSSPPQTSVANNTVAGSSVQNTSFEQYVPSDNKTLSSAETIQQVNPASLSPFLQDDDELTRYHSLKQSASIMFERVMKLMGSSSKTAHSSTSPFDATLASFPKSFLNRYETMLAEAYGIMQRKEPQQFSEEFQYYMEDHGLRHKLNALDRTIPLNNNTSWIYLKRGLDENEESSYAMITPDMELTEVVTEEASSKETQSSGKQEHYLQHLKTYLKNRQDLLQKIETHKQAIRQVSTRLKKENDELIHKITNEFIPQIEKHVEPWNKSKSLLEDYYRNQIPSQSQSEISSTVDEEY